MPSVSVLPVLDRLCRKRANSPPRAVDSTDCGSLEGAGEAGESLRLKPNMIAEVRE
jgi:hypothetical protein